MWQSRIRRDAAAEQARRRFATVTAALGGAGPAVDPPAHSASEQVAVVSDPADASPKRNVRGAGHARRGRRRPSVRGGAGRLRPADADTDLGAEPVADLPEDPDVDRIGDPPLTASRRLAGAFTDRVPVALRVALWRLDVRAALVLAAVALIAAGVAFVVFARAPRASPVPVSAVLPTFSASSAAPTAASTSAATTVVVDVAGSVRRPGVYTLPAGSRVIDAVSIAGGAMPGVDLAGLNLARVLADGEQIAVGIPSAPAPPGTTAGADVVSGPIDLNTASAADLDALPGIGPVLAQRIVTWRDEHGRFSSIDELLEVSGIGAATLADLASLVRV